MVVARVAAASGRDFWAVHGEPYYLTLYAYLQLADVERIAGLVADVEGITAALRMNWALNAPKQLTAAHDEVMARLREDVTAPPTTRGGLTDDEKAIAAALFASVMRSARETPSEVH